MNEDKEQYCENLKKICFNHYDHIYAQFLIKLYEDNIPQVKFFRAIIESYIEEEELIYKFIEKYKIRNKTKAFKDIEKTAKLKKMGKKLKNIYSFTQEEKDEIFELINGEIENETMF